MKRVKLSMLAFVMMFSTVQTKASDDAVANLISQLISNPNVMPLVAAVAAGIAKQIFDVSHGQNKTFNPLVLEMKEATQSYGPSIAAGFQAAGGSIHVKVPNELNLDAARAGFSPFFYIDCLPGSDKALLGRTDADKKAVLSLRTGLGQNCKVEARCNLSNAIWGGMAMAGLIIVQVVIATAESK